MPDNRDNKIKLTSPLEEVWSPPQKKTTPKPDQNKPLPTKPGFTGSVWDAPGQAIGQMTETAVKQAELIESQKPGYMEKQGTGFRFQQPKKQPKSLDVRVGETIYGALKGTAELVNKGVEAGAAQFGKIVGETIPVSKIEALRKKAPDDKEAGTDMDLPNSFFDNNYFNPNKLDSTEHTYSGGVNPLGSLSQDEKKNLESPEFREQLKLATMKRPDNRFPEEQALVDRYVIPVLRQLRTDQANTKTGKRAQEAAVRAQRQYFEKSGGKDIANFLMKDLPEVFGPSHRASEPTVDSVAQGLNKFYTGLNSGIGGMVTAGHLLFSELTGESDEKAQERMDNILGRIELDAKGFMPSPDIKGFKYDLIEGVGSMVPFMVASVVGGKVAELGSKAAAGSIQGLAKTAQTGGRFAKPAEFLANTAIKAEAALSDVELTSKLTAAITGAFTNAGSTYEEARKGGFSHRDAVDASMVGALIGTLEAAGIEGKFSSFGKFKPVVKAIFETAQDGGQEAISQLMGNVNAKITSGYDPQRALTEGVWESALIGSVIAGGFQSVNLAAVGANATLEYAKTKLQVKDLSNTPNKRQINLSPETVAQARQNVSVERPLPYNEEDSIERQFEDLSKSLVRPEDDAKSLASQTVGAIQEIIDDETNPNSLRIKRVVDKNSGFIYLVVNENIVKNPKQTFIQGIALETSELIPRNAMTAEENRVLDEHIVEMADAGFSSITIIPINTENYLSPNEGPKSWRQRIQFRNALAHEIHHKIQNLTGHWENSSNPNYEKLQKFLQHPALTPLKKIHAEGGGLNLQGYKQFDFDSLVLTEFPAWYLTSHIHRVMPFSKKMGFFDKVDSLINKVKGVNPKHAFLLMMYEAFQESPKKDFDNFMSAYFELLDDLNVLPEAIYGIDKLASPDIIADVKSLIGKDKYEQSLAKLNAIRALDESEKALSRIRYYATQDNPKASRYDPTIIKFSRGVSGYIAQLGARNKDILTSAQVDKLSEALKVFDEASKMIQYKELPDLSVDYQKNLGELKAFVVSLKPVIPEVEYNKVTEPYVLRFIDTIASLAAYEQNNGFLRDEPLPPKMFPGGLFSQDLDDSAYAEQTNEDEVVESALENAIDDEGLNIGSLAPFVNRSLKERLKGLQIHLGKATRTGEAMTSIFQPLIDLEGMKETGSKFDTLQAYEEFEKRLENARYQIELDIKRFLAKPTTQNRTFADYLRYDLAPIVEAYQGVAKNMAGLAPPKVVPGVTSTARGRLQEIVNKAFMDHSHNPVAAFESIFEQLDEMEDYEREEIAEALGMDIDEAITNKNIMEAFNRQLVVEETGDDSDVPDPDTDSENRDSVTSVITTLVVLDQNSIVPSSTSIDAEGKAKEGENLDAAADQHEREKLSTEERENIKASMQSTVKDFIEAVNEIQETSKKSETPVSPEDIENTLAEQIISMDLVENLRIALGVKNSKHATEMQTAITIAQKIMTLAWEAARAKENLGLSPQEKAARTKAKLREEQAKELAPGWNEVREPAEGNLKYNSLLKAIFKDKLKGIQTLAHMIYGPVNSSPLLEGVSNMTDHVRSRIGLLLASRKPKDKRSNRELFEQDAPGAIRLMENLAEIFGVKPSDIYNAIFVSEEDIKQAQAKTGVDYRTGRNRGHGYAFAPSLEEKILADLSEGRSARMTKLPANFDFIKWAAGYAERLSSDLGNRGLFQPKSKGRLPFSVWARVERGEIPVYYQSTPDSKKIFPSDISPEDVELLKGLDFSSGVEYWANKLRWHEPSPIQVVLPEDQGRAPQAMVPQAVINLFHWISQSDSPSYARETSTTVRGWTITADDLKALRKTLLKQRDKIFDDFPVDQLMQVPNLEYIMGLVHLLEIELDKRGLDTAIILSTSPDSKFSAESRLHHESMHVAQLAIANGDHLESIEVINAGAKVMRQVQAEIAQLHSQAFSENELVTESLWSKEGKELLEKLGGEPARDLYITELIPYLLEGYTFGLSQQKQEDLILAYLNDIIQKQPENSRYRAAELFEFHASFPERFASVHASLVEARKKLQDEQIDRHNEKAFEGEGDGTDQTNPVPTPTGQGQTGVTVTEPIGPVGPQPQAAGTGVGSVVGANAQANTGGTPAQPVGSGVPGQAYQVAAGPFNSLYQAPAGPTNLLYGPVRPIMLTRQQTLDKMQFGAEMEALFDKTVALYDAGYNITQNFLKAELKIGYAKAMALVEALTTHKGSVSLLGESNADRTARIRKAKKQAAKGIKRSGAFQRDPSLSMLVPQLNPVVMQELVSRVIAEASAGKFIWDNQISLADNIVKAILQYPVIIQELSDQGVPIDQVTDLIEQSTKQSGQFLEIFSKISDAFTKQIQIGGLSVLAAAPAGVRVKELQRILKMSTYGISSWERLTSLMKKYVLSAISTAGLQFWTTGFKMIPQLMDQLFTGVMIGATSQHGDMGLNGLTRFARIRESVYREMEATVYTLANLIPDGKFEIPAVKLKWIGETRAVVLMDLGIRSKIFNGPLAKMVDPKKIIEAIATSHPEHYAQIMNMEIEGTQGITQNMEDGMKMLGETLADMMNSKNEKIAERGAKSWEKYLQFRKNREFNKSLVGRLIGKQERLLDGVFLAPLRWQEFLFRQPVFVGMLSTYLRRAGYNLQELYQNGNLDVIPKEIISKAVADATYFTMAYNPSKNKGIIEEEAAANYITYMNRLSFLALETGQLFARAMFNAMKFSWEYSLLGGLTPLFGKDGFFRTDASKEVWNPYTKSLEVPPMSAETKANNYERIAKAMTGTVMMGIATALTAGDDGGEEWWQIKAGKTKDGRQRYLDIRYAFPLNFFMFMGHYINRISDGRVGEKSVSADFAELIAGIDRAPRDTRDTLGWDIIEATVEMLGGKPYNRSEMEGTSSFVGRLAAVPFTPLVNFRNMFIAFSDRENRRVDFARSGAGAAWMDKIPLRFFLFDENGVAPYGLHPLHGRTMGGFLKWAESPVLSALGFRLQEDSFAGQELSRIGLDVKRILPTDKDIQINSSQIQIFGTLLEEIGNGIKGDPDYAKKTLTDQRLMWDEITTEAASQAKEKAKELHPEGEMAKENLEGYSYVQIRELGLDLIAADIIKQIREGKKAEKISTPDADGPRLKLQAPLEEVQWDELKNLKLEAPLEEVPQ